MSVKLLIFPSDLKESLAGWSILGCRVFLFIILNVLSHSLPACRLSAEKSADSFMGAVAFLLAAFNIPSLIFVVFKSQCILVCSSLG